jgi:hypothetical protein
VGGLVGLVIDTNATIEHCLNMGQITTTNLLAGGLCGYVRESSGIGNYTLTVTDSLNVGKLSENSASKTWAGAAFGRVVNTNTAVTSTYWHFEHVLNSWTAFSNLNGNATCTMTDAAQGENSNTYHNRSAQQLLAKNEINLSFLPEGQASSATDAYYWVARTGKIPMLESFEDLLTNLEF